MFNLNYQAHLTRRNFGRGLGLALLGLIISSCRDNNKSDSKSQNGDIKPSKKPGKPR